MSIEASTAVRPATESVLSAAIAAVFTYLFGLLMGLGAVAHILIPNYYAPMVPEPIPLVLANGVAIFAEGSLAVMIFTPKARRWGLLGFTALMVAFLPIHLWDLIREDHLFGSLNAALIRLAIQFTFIGLGVWLYRRASAPRG